MTKRVAITGVLFAISLLFGGCGAGAFQIQMIPRDQDLVETQVKRDSGLFVSDKILVLDVDGVLMNQQKSSFMRSGDNPVSTFIEKLDKAADDENVKAVVLRINSPGGSVAATDAMYHNLQKFKRKTKVPVVACMLDLACSGGYYLACGSDGMIAQPSCVTGSIGTIMQTVSVAGTMRMIGVEAVAIKSGKMKDIASPLHKLRDEERQLLEGIINDFYEQFLDVVEAGRPEMDPSKLRQLADGRVYTAQQAKAAGLIDRIGYADDAVKWAKKLAAVEKARVVMYHRPHVTSPNIYSSAQSRASAGPLINIDLPEWLNAGRTQFLYLWQPGL